MMSDITLGQYFPGQSIVHRLDPRVKIMLITLLIVFLFVANNFISLFAVVAFIFVSMCMSGVPIKMYFKSLKAILLIIIFTSVLNVFYGTGDPILQIGVLKITMNGITNAVYIAIRITSLIFVSSMLTFTTSPTELTDALERVMKPLSYIKVPVHEISMMMTIALRFVPTLLEETDKIMSAQKARGADMESGGIMKRIKALIPILIPLFVSAFRRAYDLAMAMECRCYHGGEGRTKMKQLSINRTDVAVTVIVCLICVGIIAVNHFIPAI